MKSIYSLLIVLIVAFCCSCGGTSPEGVSEKADTTTPAPAPTLSESFDGQISKERFAGMLRSANKLQLVDVRTAEEYAAGSIDGALNFDFHNDDFSSQLKSLDHARPVFIYCQSGGRSGKTYKILKGMGVEKVYDLKGGYADWE